MLLSNATMNAVLFAGIPFNVSVGRVPVPTIQSETDVIVKVTAAAICGTDLHIYRGTYGNSGPINPPNILGHEAMGIIAEVGSAVSFHKVGDYVVIPDRIDNFHLPMQPEPYTAFGTPNLPGSQAEYVRVPVADFSLIPIPVGNGSEPSIDYLFLSDIFPTAWTALDYSGFQPGDTVAIFGAGPVGLLTAYSAILRGAAKVYSVDSVPARLEIAASIGAIPISFNSSNPVEQILAKEPNGVRRVIDACGYEAVNESLSPQPDIILQQMVALAGRNGGIGVAGVYTGGNGTEANPALNMGELWMKAVSVGMGAVNPLIFSSLLEDLISSGKARPSFIVSREASIEEAPEMYARFEQHLESKVVFRFK